MRPEFTSSFPSRITQSGTGANAASGSDSLDGASAGDASSSGTPSQVPQSAAEYRILVVESDIDTADLVVALLENAGFAVEIATDGQYGLMLANTFEPHLIMLGLSLPGMNGYEMTQILRNEPRYSQRFRFTRIFYLTSKDHMLQKRFHSLPGTPMSDYIFKPVDIPELLDKVRRAFADMNPVAEI